MADDKEYDDYWAKAVKLFTGYEAPSRHDLFKDMVGNAGIKQMKVEITKQGSVQTVDVDDFNWMYENAGWDIQNTDFVIPFYTNDSGTVHYYKARFTLLGFKSADGPGSGEVVGGEGKSKYGKELEDGHFKPSDNGTVWNTFDLTSYAYGTGNALKALLEEPNGTLGFSWGGKPEIPLDKGVRLASFDMAADAFDRVAKFFWESNATMTEWQNKVGLDQNEAWKGQAAGVFWDLIHELGRRYGHYADDMEAIGGVSKQGKVLRQAGDDLEKQARKVYNKWDDWKMAGGNPLRPLVDLLGEIGDQTWLRNLTKINADYEYSPGGYYGGGSGYWDYSAAAGFSQDAYDADLKSYGDMKELETWKKVGDQAIANWEAKIKTDLIDPAEQALKDLAAAWGSSHFDLGSIRTKGDKGLEESFQDDKAYKDKKDAEDKAAKDKADADAKYAADKKAAEDKAAADKAAADKKYADDKKAADDKAAADKAAADKKYAEEKAAQEQKEKEQEAKQEAKEKEAEEKAAALQAKQDQKEKEAEEKAAQKEKEQEKKEAEQEAKQEQKEKEAEQKQAEQEKKQEQIRQEQEAKQEQKEKEQEQKQEQKEKEAEQKQAEQQAKQDEAQKQAQAFQVQQVNQQKAEQEKRDKEQAKKEAEQEAKQEQLQQEQEKKQAEQEAKQEQKEKEQEQKQEQKEKEAEQKQAEQEKKQEQIRQEQEKKQEEQQKQAEQKQAEQEQKQEQKEKEAEQKQAETEKKQEQIRQEQEQKQEQQQKEAEKKQAEQEQKQEQIRQEQEQKQDEYQQKQEKAQEERQKQQEDLQQQQQQKQDEYQKQQLKLNGSLNNGDLGQYNNGDPTQLNNDFNHLSPNISGPVNGDDSLTNPDGSRSHLDAQGRVVTEFPDGSKSEIDPHTQTSTITRPDGSHYSGPLNSGDSLTNPDGSTTHLDPQGQVVTEYPDGSTTRVDPDTGATSITSPDGTSTTGYLNNPDNALPDYQYNNGPGGNSHLGGALNNPTSYDYGNPSYEEELYDDKPYQEPSLGNPGQSSGGGSPNAGGGTPLNSGPMPSAMGGSPGGMPMGGMPMGGMGGMGGAGGGKGGEGGSSERVRNVIDNGDVVSNRRNAPIPRGKGGAYEDRQAVSTSGGNPYLPGMGGNGGPGQTETESSDREREVWEPEEDDVWGTDEGGSPAVIGR